MSLELYTITNFLATIYILAGFIIPALIIYFYSSYKNHFVLIITAVLLAVPALLLREKIIVLLPFILPILFAGFMGSLLKKYGEDFWYSMGYMIVAKLTGMIIGIIAVYFYFGMQDIASLVADGFKNAYINLPTSDPIAMRGFNSMIQFLLFIKDGIMPVSSDIAAMSMTEKLDIIVPLIKEGMTNALPSMIMSYGIISGVWSWFISSVMIQKRKEAKKELKGIDNFVQSPPFSEWKLPRWFTNILMVLLLAAIFLSFLAGNKMINVASVLQTVVFVILGIQGLSVLNWWFKNKKIHIAVNVLLCCAAVIFLSFMLPWIGMFDIFFSIRISREQKEEILKKMQDIRNQVDRQMNETEKDEEESNNEKEDKDIKQDGDDSDESEEEK